MHEFVRIACAIQDVQVGNVKKNGELIRRAMEQAGESNADLLLLPELALTGCTCGDLFGQDALYSAIREQLRLLVTHSGSFPGLVTVVGLPLRIRGLTYNCAAVIATGEVCGIVPKTRLSQERGEHRWFTPWQEKETVFLEPAELGLSAGEDFWAVTLTHRQLFHLGDDAMVAVQVGENDCSDTMELVLGGAEVILNPTALAAFGGSGLRNDAWVRDSSRQCGCVYACASAGMTESTQDLVYSGFGAIAECGDLLAVNRGLTQGCDMLLSDCDLGRVRARLRALRRERRPNAKDMSIREPFSDALRGDGAYYPVSKTPYLPEDPAERRYFCLEVFSIQAAGLMRRLQFTGLRPVIGVSGGLDSTLALLVAVEALRRMGKPASELHGVSMPGFGTSGRTGGNARKLMELLGVTRAEIPIREAVSQHFRDIGHDPMVHDATYENAQARERTQILMDYAGAHKGIVVGTGDLSELALGWCTYNGDQMSMYGVNGSIPKTMLRSILEAVAELDHYKAAASVLRDILATPISPELLPPDEAGHITQETEALVGPYILHDFFLYHTLLHGFAPGKIYAMACRAFAGEYSQETVKQWLVFFYRRFFSQQFKRSCMPDGVNATGLSLSPRNAWQMPSDASAELWLREAEAL